MRRKANRGETRQQEALAAAAVLGLFPDDLFPVFPGGRNKISIRSAEHIRSVAAPVATEY
jgi:hypothetical protein